MPCAQVTRSSKMNSTGCIGSGPQAEQQRCGEGRPTGAAAESSNAFGESGRSASGSKHGWKRSPNGVDESCLRLSGLRVTGPLLAAANG